MITKIVLNTLQKSYPGLILISTLAIWSCSNLKDVAPLLTPPIADGFTFHWNPEILYTKGCGGNHLNEMPEMFSSCKITDGSEKLPKLFSDVSQK